METKQRKSSKVVFLAVVALICFWAILGSAGNLNPSAPPGPTMKTLDEVEARIPIQSLPSSGTAHYVISQSGSYYLTGNITTAETDKHGIEITASDVTIELNGYALIGPGPTTGTSGCGIEGGSRTRVENGSIRDWRSNGISLGSCSAVENCRIYHNGESGILVGHSSIVEKCIASDNSGDGINMGENSAANNCVAYSNDGNGIWGGSYTVIRRCTARNHRNTDKSGIGLIDGGVITDCVVSSNKRGIYGSRATITGCSAHSNYDYGIFAGTYCQVEGNTCVYNSGHGIHAQGNGNAVLRNHCANNNCGLSFFNSHNYSAQNTLQDNSTDICGSHQEGSGDLANVVIP